MDVVLDVDADSDSDAYSEEHDGLSPADWADWAEVEQDLHRLYALHTEATQRMEALRMTLALEDAGLIPTIQSCHEASLEELERTGEVTFGARLLAALQAEKA